MHTAPSPHPRTPHLQAHADDPAVGVWRLLITAAGPTQLPPVKTSLKEAPAFAFPWDLNALRGEGWGMGKASSSVNAEKTCP